MSKLVKAGSEETLARKLMVEVRTSAQPDKELLLRARGLIRQHGDLREAFEVSRVDRQYLLNRLSSYLGKHEGDLPSVAEYLADEHEQLGDGILVISPQTGRAIAKLKDEDFYQPAPVPREMGTMITPPVRVRPEIESYIIQKHADGAREREQYAQMLARIPCVSYLPDAVARRKALFVTKAGRSEVAKLIHDRLPKLIEGVQGSAREFFKFFPMGVCQNPCESMEVNVSALVQLGVQDVTTQNMNHDVFTAASAAIPAVWARTLAKVILAKSAQWASMEVREVVGDGLYLASANTSPYVHGAMIVVDEPDGVVVCLTNLSGSLEIHDYASDWREVHDKWVFEASFTGVLHLEWDKIQVLKVEGIEISGVVMEMTH